MLVHPCGQLRVRVHSEISAPPPTPWEENQTPAASSPRSSWGRAAGQNVLASWGCCHKYPKLVNSRNLFSHCSGGRKQNHCSCTEMKVSAGLGSLQRLWSSGVGSFPRLFQLLMAGSIPWLRATSSHLSLLHLHISSQCMCVMVGRGQTSAALL